MQQISRRSEIIFKLIYFIYKAFLAYLSTFGENYHELIYNYWFDNTFVCITLNCICPSVMISSLLLHIYIMALIKNVSRLNYDWLNIKPFLCAYWQ